MTFKQFLKGIISVAFIWLTIITLLPTFFDIKLVGDEHNLLNQKRLQEYNEINDELQDSYVVFDLKDTWEVINDDGNFTGDLIEISNSSNDRELQGYVQRRGDVFQNFDQGFIVIKDISIKSSNEGTFDARLLNKPGEWIEVQLSLYKDRIDISIYGENDSKRRAQLYLRRS
jgi:hypothetical protein